MGDVTGIAWTDHTFNPWVGCSRVSAGCEHCYAEARDRRWGGEHWGKTAERQVTSRANWRRPLKWNRDAAAAGRRALVFCASLADVFEDRPDLHEPRARLFEMIEATPHLIWQLLTKRPENIARLIPFRWHAGEWPDNVWWGTTVEDHSRRDRVPVLLELGGPVRFLSCEPLLSDVDLTPWFDEGIDWVIAGGESGPGYRPLDLDDARGLRDQCDAFGVPFFFKQIGGWSATAGGALLDGELLQAFPPAAGDRREGVEVAIR